METRKRAICTWRTIVAMAAFATAFGLLAQTAAAASQWAFAPNSPWNTPAAQRGTVSGDNPYASLFLSYDDSLVLGGGPAGSDSHDHDYAKPTYFASPGDPCRPIHVRHADWAHGNIQYQGECVPVPSGVQAAGGSDGHLEVISADRTRGWAMWRCNQGGDGGAPCSEANVLAGGYDAANVSVWDFGGVGVAECCGNATGRGSGTPLYPTVLTAADAVTGFQHALGITVPHVSSSFIYPAAKSDGSCGCPLKYGMLFILRPDFPENGSVGRGNVIRALKTYGAVGVDQGASFEIDTEGDYAPGARAAFSAAGISRNVLGDVRPSDMRYVATAGGPAPTALRRPARSSKRARAAMASRKCRHHRKRCRASTSRHPIALAVGKLA